LQFGAHGRILLKNINKSFEQATIMTSTVFRTRISRAGAVFAVLALSACDTGIGSEVNGVTAPGVNRLATAEHGVEVGHRLIAAGEHELALRAFTRAAIERGGTDAEILSGMGSANLGLGRLNQAERLMRVALEKDTDSPELYNNLGVILMEKGETGEAAQIFRKAFALDNGRSDAIRDNLRLALSKSDNSVIGDEDQNDYKLVRRGAGDFLISRKP